MWEWSQPTRIVGLKIGKSTDFHNTKAQESHEFDGDRCQFCGDLWSPKSPNPFCEEFYLQKMNSTRLSYVLALLAFGLWGLFPLYFEPISHLNVWLIAAHRIVWSFVLLALMSVPLTLLTRRGGIAPSLAWVWKFPIQTVLVYGASAFCLTSNWMIWLWAVQHKQILEGSLGYLLTPLLTIALGIVVYRESLTALQKMALGFAVIGIGVLTYEQSALPWIAVSLAISFALYGWIKKAAPLPALPGLFLEMVWMLPIALGIMIWVPGDIWGSLHLERGWALNQQVLWLMGSGAVTLLPLALFGAASHRIPMTHMGFLQYLAPIGQFLCGLLVFQEAFGWLRALGFGWIALALVLVSGTQLSRPKPRVEPS